MRQPKIPKQLNDEVNVTASPELKLWIAVVERLFDDLRSAKEEYAEEYFINRKFIEHIIDANLGLSDHAAELVKNELWRLASAIMTGDLTPSKKVRRGTFGAVYTGKERKDKGVVRAEKLEERLRRYELLKQAVKEFNNPYTLVPFIEILGKLGLTYHTYQHFKTLKGYPLPSLDKKKKKITQVMKLSKITKERNRKSRGGLK